MRMTTTESTISITIRETTG
jgi:hypothetical protein